MSLVLSRLFPKTRQDGGQMSSAAVQLSEAMECLPRAKAAAGKSVKCVLLIEDNEDAMLLVRFALKEYGGGRYQLEWANCLTEGLSRILRGGIDVVVLDLGLPDSSGPVSYTWVREAAPEVPVVVLTGDTREETELTVFSSGVHDYLVKDQISASRLVSVIHEALCKDERRQHTLQSSSKHSERIHWR